MQLVHHYILDSALKHPGQSAIICDDVRLSYAEFNAKINALAEMFIVEGLRKGDRVLILLRDKIDFLVSAYAVARAGGIAVPLFELAPFETILAIAADCAPRLLVASQRDLAQHPLLRDALNCHTVLMENATRSSLHRVLVSQPEHQTSPAEGADRITKLMELTAEDGALLLYTANLDGRLRGALFTHRNLIQSTLRVNAHTGADASRRECITFPLAQSMGFGRARAVFFAGGTVVLSNGPIVPGPLIENALNNRANGFSLAPEVFSALLHEAAGSMRRAGAEMEFVELGAAALSLTERHLLLEVFPRAKIYLQYGFTEAPRSVFTELRSDQRKPDTSGRPLPETSIAVIEEAGALLPAGKTGEIIIAGDHLFERYWSGESSFQLTRGGQRWFRTNDMGVLDREGYLLVLGRKEEIINMSGLKISPTEVEEKIRLAYPGMEICVIGIPDPAGIVGEIPVLCYVAQEGMPMISSELSTILSSSLERNKIPRIVFRVEGFPKTENAVARLELRRQILAGISQPLVPVA